MGEQDILSRQIFKHLVRDFAIYLFGLPVSEVDLLESSNQRMEDRRADLVARVTTADGETFILHIEIQNANEVRMPVRMLRYLTDILFAHPKFNVRQYLVYIGKKPLRMANGLNLARLDYGYEIIDMSKVDCKGLLSHDSPDAWVLAILCDFKGRTAHEMVHTILTQLVERLTDQPPRLREYMSMLEILAANRNLEINISEEFEMLRIDFEKLPTYQMGMKKGLEKGIGKGIEIGAHEQTLAIAAKLLAEGADPAWIVSVTSLSMAEIEALKKSKQSA
ncbi:MAG: Rpn family recombination-promoting nuclease/putative transposase [Methylococcales bacterium]